MIKQSFLLLALLIFPLFAFSQEQEEDETKMVREVITVDVDRAKFAPPQPAAPVEDNSKKKKKHHTEEPPPVVADTGSPMMPAPVSEINRRANNWLNAKSTKYTKANGATSGSTTSCIVTFPYKQKNLNPENDVDGKITMDVTIEAKEGKYRYTVKNIKHVADKPGMSGGNIYGTVPECGSMKCSDLTWKHIKSAAYADIQIVTEDLKAKMKEEGEQKKKDEW